MAKGSQLSSLLGPTAISIHDNSHMFGKPTLIYALIYGHYKLKIAPKGDANVLYCLRLIDKRDI
jgi:hypothetical protein